MNSERFFNLAMFDMLEYNIIKSPRLANLSPSMTQ